jgi:hypothetical protein
MKGDRDRGQRKQEVEETQRTGEGVKEGNAIRRGLRTGGEEAGGKREL